MINQQSERLQSCIASSIGFSYCLLSYHIDTILQITTKKKVRVFNFLYKPIEHKIVEIELDTATLNCICNDEGICVISYLFLNDPEHLPFYIDYCNRTFNYDSILQLWETPKCCFELRSDMEDYYFIFY